MGPLRPKRNCDACAGGDAYSRDDGTCAGFLVRSRDHLLGDLDSRPCSFVVSPDLRFREGEPCGRRPKASRDTASHRQWRTSVVRRRTSRERTGPSRALGPRHAHRSRAGSTRLHTAPISSGCCRSTLRAVAARGACEASSRASWSSRPGWPSPPGCPGRGRSSSSRPVRPSWPSCPPCSPAVPCTGSNGAEACPSGGTGRSC